MKKIITVTGERIPFVWNDIEFIQDATSEAIKGLCSKFGIGASESFKISGCETTYDAVNLRWDVTEGYFCLEGEICKVDAHTTSNSGTVHWGIIETYDSEGAKSDGDGSSHQTYLVRQAKLLNGTPPSSYVLPECQTLQDRLIEIVSRDLVVKADNTIPYAYLSLPSYRNGWKVKSGYTAVRYRIDQLGYIEIKGIIDPSAATSGEALQLPAGFSSLSFDPVHSIAIAESGVMASIKLDDAGVLSFSTYSTVEDYYKIDLRFKK